MREKEDKGSQTFFIPIYIPPLTAPNITAQRVNTMNSLFFSLLKRLADGREPPTEFWRLIKGNGQCHIPFPSSMTFGCNGLGLISTIWLQLEKSVE